MRIRLLVLLATMSLCGVAQRGGGMPAGQNGGGGRWGNQFPIKPPFPGFGKRPWWGSQQRGFGPFTGYWPGAGAFDTPLCASPLFPLAPSCSFGGGDLGYYQPPPPMEASPTTNAFVMPPPPPPAAAFVPITKSAAADGISSLPQTTPTPALPARSPGVPDQYPPVIVLKTGGMYSITKYWFKKNTIYFQTTAGDVLYAPVTQLDQMLPGSKP